MKRTIHEISENTEYPPTKVNLVERNSVPAGVQLVNPLKSGKHHHNDLITLATEIQKADHILAATTCGKLKLISEQIKRLQKDAINIMEKGMYDVDLHRVPCNFQKIPGTIYHLYQRNSGQQYFSMLSPKDWNYCQPHKFLGSYRLNNDQSWTDANAISDAGPLNYDDIEKFESMISAPSSIQNIINPTESYHKIFGTSHQS